MKVLQCAHCSELVGSCEDDEVPASIACFNCGITDEPVVVETEAQSC